MFLIDASNNSIGFTYGYLRFTPLGLGIFVEEKMLMCHPEGVKCE